MAIPLTQAEAHFHYSTWHLLRVAALCAVLIIAIAGAITVRLTRTLPPVGIDGFLIHVIVSLLACWGFAWAAQNLRQRRNIISISMRGIKDIRVASDWIPWHKITGITQSKLGKQKSLHLKLDPEFKRQLPRHRALKRLDGFIASLVRRIFDPSQVERILVPAVAINTLNVNADIDDLVEAIKRYAPNPVFVSSL
jgi:hypothetical protein